jgi:hypothetical protein
MFSSTIPEKDLDDFIRIYEKHCLTPISRKEALILAMQIKKFVYQTYKP